jgi:chromate reductase
MTNPANNQPYDIAVLVGSLRKQSWNRKVAHALVALAPPSLKLEIVEIGALPLYNQDLEVEPPPSEWAAFRDRLRRARGLIFVTPEYNRSVPAALKNAIDVGSRPWGKSIWAKKPALVVSASPGASGGFGANHHLRQSLVTLDVYTLAQPEAYLSGIDKSFNEAGELIPGTRDFLTKVLHGYADWTAKTLRANA